MTCRDSQTGLELLLGARTTADLWTHNTLMVLLGTMLLGATAGLIGVFLILRRQALMSDVVGHASLPGVIVGFLLLERIWPGSGKNIRWLTAGAFAAGIIAAMTTLLVQRRRSVKSDAAMALVLGVFYGLGAALLAVVQQIESGSQAGLMDYIIGMTASLVASDVQFFALSAVIVFGVSLILFKELTLVCFDEGYAATRGLPVFWIDALLLLMVAAVTVLGLQSVGLILVVATLITPAVSARFWTDRVTIMAGLSTLFGATASLSGSLISAAVPRAAAGPTIVLMGSIIFLLSLSLGGRRGLLRLWWHERTQQRLEGRHHLLRAAFECIERQQGPLSALQSDGEKLTSLTFHPQQLLGQRYWADREIQRQLRDACALGWLEPVRETSLWKFTPAGWQKACELVRNHRLWELYLIQHVEMAADLADRTADRIEHVIDPEVCRELEEQLRHPPGETLPESPHEL